MSKRKKIFLTKAQMLKEVRLKKPEPDRMLAMFIVSNAMMYAKRWDGRDIMGHIVFVAFSDSSFDEERHIIGILHDLIEDTDWTLADLKTCGFSQRVIDGVDAMTKRKKRGWKEAYFDATERASVNPDARALKPLDNEHNTRDGKMTAKKKYVYPYSTGYHKAAERGDIVPGSNFWDYMVRFHPDVLRDPNFRRHVKAKNRSSRPMPRPSQISALQKKLAA